VNNQGTIGGSTVAGVFMAAGGTVTNQADGAIDGGEAGILVENANGSVSNQRVILQQGAYSSNGAIGGVLLLDGGTLDNEGGTITGTSYGVDVANAVGTVTNTGSIASSDSAGGAGGSLDVGLGSGAIGQIDLTGGMLVETWHGDVAEIVWIGRRHVDCSQHPAPATVCPVRVLAGAFGPGRPSRDLWLSPDHAVFVDGVLIAVDCLLNGGTIRQMLVPEVTYYHVELAEHDVILAEDLAVESYLDTGNRANFHNATGPVRLFPDFSARMWEMAGCAALVTTGPMLEWVQQALARNNVVGVGAAQYGSPRALWLRLNNHYTYY